MATKKKTVIEKIAYAEIAFDDCFEALSWLQANIKVEKNGLNQHNGSRYYRVEDILKATKELTSRIKGLCLSRLVKKDQLLDGSPIKEVSYILRYKNADGEVSSVEVNDFVVVNSGNKGMTSEQASGSASTYASKYALQSMFMLDDDIDSDYTSSDYVGDGGDYSTTDLQEYAKKKKMANKLAGLYPDKVTEELYNSWLSMDYETAEQEMIAFNMAQGGKSKVAKGA